MTVTSIAQTASGRVPPQLWADLLRAQGLRATAQRIAVLALLHRGGHLDADDVAAALRSEGGSTASITVQSVYVVLTGLERAGLIRRIDLGTGRALYEARTQDNHHHAVCRVCGRIEDVDCAVGHAPCLAPSSTSMAVEVAEVVFRGVCAECAAAEEGEDGPEKADTASS